MTDTIESLRAERDELALKLWRIATGKASATAEIMHRTNGEIETSIRILMEDAIRKAIDQQRSYTMPSYFYEMVRQTPLAIKIETRAFTILERNHARFSLRAKVPDLNVSLAISNNDLHAYASFQKREKKRAMFESRTEPQMLRWEE